MSTTQLNILDLQPVRYTFSGHEKFHCRSFWLKKGVDFVKEGHDFNSPDAVVALGVGKNMVGAIRHWLKAFQLIENDGKLTEFARKFFNATGYDPYLEDIGSLWLLHRQLAVNKDTASAYHLLFNDFRRVRMEFTKAQLLAYLTSESDKVNGASNENTLNADIAVLFKNYLRPRGSSQNLEDDFSGILIDLNLIQPLEREEADGVAWFKIQNEDRPQIPWQIVLYAILDQYEGRSLSFQALLNDANSPGAVFCLSANGLFLKIQEIVLAYPSITYKEDGGVRELQLNEPIDKWEVLKKYYG